MPAIGIVLMAKRSPTLFIRCTPKNLRLMATGVNLNPRLQGLIFPALQARTCLEIRHPCLKIRKSVLEVLTMFH